MERYGTVSRGYDCRGELKPRRNNVGIGVSIFLIALGAILAFAVTAEISGLEVEVVGWILLAVGILGLVLSMIFWSSWGGPGGMRRRTTYVEDGPPAGPPY
jgi:Domain of unknown function (DUF6458)